MATPRDEKKFRSLAAWVARGRTIRSWCRKHDVSYNTAREWSPLPEFRDLVARLRQESLDGFVSIISGSLRPLARELISIAKKDERSHIRLQAIRAAVADMLAADESSRLARELAELRSEIESLKRGRGEDESKSPDAPTS